MRLAACCRGRGSQCRVVARPSTVLVALAPKARSTAQHRAALLSIIAGPQAESSTSTRRRTRRLRWWPGPGRSNERTSEPTAITTATTATTTTQDGAASRGGGGTLRSRGQQCAPVAEGSRERWWSLVVRSLPGGWALGPGGRRAALRCTGLRWLTAARPVSYRP